MIAKSNHKVIDKLLTQSCSCDLQQDYIVIVLGLQLQKYKKREIRAECLNSKRPSTNYSNSYSHLTSDVCISHNACLGVSNLIL